MPKWDIYIIPAPKAQGILQKRGKRNTIGRGSEECCEMLSLGHDMAVTLMNTQQPWLLAYELGKNQSSQYSRMDEEEIIMSQFQERSI